MSLKHKDTSLRFLDGGGEMGVLMRQKDWSTTSLGNPENWPQSLRTTVSILLNTKHPMYLWWGPELICFYNDAYRPSLGQKGKHPNMLGGKGIDYWQEIWHIIFPQIEQVMNTGEATWNEDMLVPIYRNGTLEDVYWTYSYSPVLNEEGSVNGVLVICDETTQKLSHLKELENSEQKFRWLVNEAPIATAMLVGQNHRIELANDEVLKLWGKGRSILGNDLLDVLPEFASQKYASILNKVYSEGTTYEGSEEVVYTETDGVVSELYINFTFKALRNSAGNVYAILAMGYNVTNEVDARKKIADAEERARLAIDAASLGTFDVDLKTKIVSPSNRMLEVFGIHEKGPLPSSQFLKYIHPEDLHIRDTAYKTLWRNGTLSYEARLIKDDNSLHWFAVQAKLYYNKEGKPIRLLGSVRDVSSQKEAEIKLRESEQRFRNTVQQAPVGIIILRGKSLIVEVANTSYLELVDRTEENFLGRPLFESLPEVKESVSPIIENVFNTGKPYQGLEFEVPLVRHGNTEVTYFNFVYQPLFETDGKVNGIIAVAIEVTPQVKARHALEESSKQFRSLVLQSPIPMALFRGPDLIIEMANQAMLNTLWRRSFDEVYGHKLLDIFPELKGQQYPIQLNKVVDSGITVSGTESEIFIDGADGMRKFYIDFEYAPLFNTDKTVSGVLVTVNNVTETVQARQQLKEAAYRLQMATDGSKVATWDLDLRNLYVIHSPQLALIFGYPEDNHLSHLQMRDHVHPDDISLVMAAFDSSLKTGFYNYEARIVLRNKSIRWIKTIGKVIFDRANTPLRMLGTMMEVTERKQAEESLQKLAAIVQTSNDAIISKRLDGIITSWNKAAERIFGYTEDEMIGQSIFKLIPLDRTSEETEIITKIKRKESIEHFETIRLHKDGAPVNVSLAVSPLVDSNGNIIGASKIARDVTAQRLAEKRIIENEERLQIVISASEIGTWELDFKTKKFVYSNRDTKIFGHNNNEDVDHDYILKRIHPNDVPIRDQAFQKAIETGSLHYVSRLIWDDQSVHWIDIRGKVFYNERNEPVKLVGTARDITDEKFYQHRIEESEKRFRSVADNAPVLIWMCNTEKKCGFFNKAWLNFTGRSMEEEFGFGWTNGIHPDDYDRCADVINIHFDLQQQFYVEFRLKRHDGEYRWVSNNGVPRFTADGVFEGFIGACMDIHDRILFEEKLKKSESRLRIAALSSELGTWDYNPETEVLVFDNASNVLFDLEDGEVISKSMFFEKIHPDDRELTRLAIERSLDPALAELYDLEYRVMVGKAKDQIRWIHSKGKASFDENGNPRMFAGTLLDITEKRLALTELQESEQKFRLLADSMPQFIWTGDSEGNINYFNNAIFKYTGLQIEDLENGGWLQIIHPDDREKNMEEWMHSVKTGAHFVLEHRFKRIDGEYRWHISRAIPQKDEDGKIQMWVSSSTDIHDRKIFTDELESKVRQRTAELHQLNENLVKSNAELAQFAYVASHDLQEPLRKIQTFATRLIEFEYKNLSERGKDYFIRMQSAAKRMQQLIVDLLSYSQANASEKHYEEKNLSDVLKTVLDQLRETIEQKQAIIEADELPVMNVIVYQMEQLFTNIIGNALKFSKNNEPPFIKIKLALVAGNELKIQGANVEKTYAHIRICDNGIGFDPQFRERIFQVFQRLHGREEYAGTGIGLAICKKIVDNHKGFISADGKSNEGAVFNIYLPLE